MFKKKVESCRLAVATLTNYLPTTTEHWSLPAMLSKRHIEIRSVLYRAPCTGSDRVEFVLYFLCWLSEQFRSQAYVHHIYSPVRLAVLVTLCSRSVEFAAVVEQLPALSCQLRNVGDSMLMLLGYGATIWSFSHKNSRGLLSKTIRWMLAGAKNRVACTHPHKQCYLRWLG